MFHENIARQVFQKTTFLTPWYAHVRSARRFASCLVCSIVFLVINGKTLCSKDLTRRSMRESFTENNCNYDSYDCSYKFAFVPENFRAVDDLVTSNKSVFSLLWIALYFKGMPIWIDFYKGIFLRAINCSCYSSMPNPKHNQCDPLEKLQ